MRCICSGPPFRGLAILIEVVRIFNKVVSEENNNKEETEREGITVEQRKRLCGVCVVGNNVRWGMNDALASVS